MTEQDTLLLRSLEGCQVSLALTDGSRIDDCQLVSAGLPGNDSLWVFVNGVDWFVPRGDVIDAWEH